MTLIRVTSLENYRQFGVIISTKESEAAQPVGK